VKAPFPYFGGKREIADVIWSRLGSPRQYIEPFCGSAAVLLAAPSPAALEVVCDLNGFIANFWRAVKHQPAEVANAADYPVSHIDLGARHVWLMQQRERIGNEMQDPDWPGDAKVAGWWLWGQCCWIGSGWCEWDRPGAARWQRGDGDSGAGPGEIDATSAGRGIQALGQVPHAGDAGRGIQALGQVPHAGNAGRGIQALGQVPHAGNAGRGIQALGQVPHASSAGMGIQALGQVPHAGSAGMGDALLTSAGRAAWLWLHKLADRLERVRVVHGEWSRCLNNHFGGNETAVFLDPPYRAYEGLYGSRSVADEVCHWAGENGGLRVALCGHVGDYELPGWDVLQWKRPRLTYAGSSTTDKEAIWFSPSCLKVGGRREQLSLLEQAL
jgi:hypothetical protein